MNKLGTIVMAAAAVVVLGSGVTASAFADTPWQAAHPRREEVNNRLHNQDRRINQERREGELSRGQAARLHREDRQVRHEERTMARFDHGHLTRADQRALNSQENHISRQIGR